MSVTIQKAAGFAVVGPPPDSVVIQKAAGFAVLDSSTFLAVRKAAGFAVLQAQVAAAPARRPVVFVVT